MGAGSYQTRVAAERATTGLGPGCGRPDAGGSIIRPGLDLTLVSPWAPLPTLQRERQDPPAGFQGKAEEDQGRYREERDAHRDRVDYRLP